MKFDKWHVTEKMANQEAVRGTPALKYVKTEVSNFLILNSTKKNTWNGEEEEIKSFSNCKVIFIPNWSTNT